MPKIFCCLCNRRTETNKQRVRIGSDSNWALFCIHAEKTGLDVNTFSKDGFVCIKCHGTISHYRMKDRGPNKIVQDYKPIAHEPGITKEVLRSFAKSNVDTIEGNCSNIIKSSVGQLHLTFLQNILIVRQRIQLTQAILQPMEYQARLIKLVLQFISKGSSIQPVSSIVFMKI